MRKIWIAAVVLIASLIVFGAAKNDPVVELKVLHYADASAPGYAADKAIWDMFQKNNPNIKLNIEILFNEAFHQKLQAYVAAGTLPDVFYVWPTSRSAAVFDKKLAKDLTPLLGASYLANFAPAAVNPKNIYGGYLGVLPQSYTYTSVLYVNKKILKDNGFDIPKTYADLKKMVLKLKAKGIQVIAMPNKDNWVGQSCLLSTVAGRYADASYFDQIAMGKAKFTDKPFVDALDMIQTMYKDGVLATTDTQVGYGDGPATFANGKAAMFLDGDWRAGAFITDKSTGKALISPAMQSSDYALIALPALPGEKNPGVVSATPGTGYAIAASVPAGSDKEKAAVTLIKYLYSPDVMKQRLESGSFLPTLKGVTGKVDPFINMMSDFHVANAKTGYVLDAVFDGSVITVLNNGVVALANNGTTAAKLAADTQAAQEKVKK